MPQEYTFDEVTAAPEPTSYSFDELKPQTEWSFDELKPPEAKPEDFQAFSELGPTQADTAYLEQPLIPIPTLKGESTLGKIGAGVFNVAKSIPEFMETPAGMATIPASFIPGAGPVLQGLFAGLAAKQAGEKLGEASVSKDVQDYTEGVLGAALAPAIGLPHSAKAVIESIKETAEPKDISNAIQPESPQPIRALRDESIQSPQQVPPEGAGPKDDGGGNQGEPTPGAGIVPPEAEQARVPLTIDQIDARDEKRLSEVNSELDSLKSKRPKPTTEKEAWLEGDPMLKGQTKWDAPLEKRINELEYEKAQLGEGLTASKKEPWQMTKEEYAATEPKGDGKRESFTAKIGSQEIPVVKNPTPEDYQKFNEEHNRLFPDDVSGNPKTRFTLDSNGNRYIWPSGDAAHPAMEGWLKENRGVTANQNTQFLSHNYHVRRALFARKNVPAEVLKDYPNLQTTPPPEGTRTDVQQTAQTPGEVVGMGGATPSEFSPEVATPDVYGIAQRLRESRAAAGQVEPIEPGQGISAEASVEHGREILAKDPLAGEKAVASFKADPEKRISASAMASSRAHGERLALAERRSEEKFGTDSPEYQHAYEAMSDWDKRTKPMQTEWSKIGEAQQGMTDIDTGSFAELRREWKRSTDKDFSKNQKKVAEQKADAVREVKNEEQQAQEKFVKATQETRSLTDAEKAAQQAVWRQHREAAIRGAKAENAKRLADIDRADAVRAVQEAAKKRAQDAVNKTLTGMSKKAADLENAKRVKAADDRLKIAEADRKKADIKLRKAQAEIRNAAIKAVRANNKLRVLKADLPAWAWTKAKEYIVTGHENLNDIVAKIGTDTGLSNKQVLDALGKDKRKKYLADDVWRKQQRVRLLDQSTKRWLRQQQMPFLLRSGERLASGMFTAKIGGGLHGFVALGTHAPMAFFRPNILKTYLSNYGQMARMIKNRAFYEASIQDLQRRPNYRRANEFGLGNDPYMYEDFSTKEGAGRFKKLIGGALGAGNRGYSVLKFLRQDLFDRQWDKLPLTSRTPEMGKAIATYVNHETGWSQKAGFKGAHLGLFAPRLLMAKTGYVFGDPLKMLGVAAKMAASTVSNWEKATPAEKHFAAHVFKEKATVVATMASMLAINQAILSATGSDQKINGVPEELGGKGFDPMASDFLKFKGAGKTVSYGNSFLALARLPARIVQNISNQSKLNKIVYEDENVYKTLGSFARTQLSPAAGALTDLALGRDFQGRPLPRKFFGLMEGDTNVPKRLRAQGVQPYTWTEYTTVTGLPIPLAEAMHDVWHDGYGLDEKGVDWMQKLWAIIQTIPETTAMGLTGARIGEDYDVKK